MSSDGRTQVSNISDEASRCYGDGSSFGLAEHMHAELAHRLEIQQKSSAISHYHDLVAEISTNVVRRRSDFILAPII
jgi:hypothetical protein